VPVRNADKRAIELHFLLLAAAELPFVEISVQSDNKQPIFIQDRFERSFWRNVSIDYFLTFDIEQAKAAGGTARALLESGKKSKRAQLPQTEIDRAVDQFLKGEDDE
jgi:hypothetical protein